MSLFSLIGPVIWHKSFRFCKQAMSAQVHKFKVEMTCDGCSNAVKKVLGKQEGKVEIIDVNLECQTVEVKSELSSDELLAILQKTGKQCSHLSSTAS